MRLNVILIIAISLGFSDLLKAQNFKNQLLPFERERYEEALKKFDILQFDSSYTIRDSVLSNINDHHAMRILEVPEKEMAQIPKMKISRDFNYTLRIKKYENNYYPKPNIPKSDSLFRKDDLLPLTVPKEK